VRERSSYRKFSGNSEEKKQLGIPRTKFYDNIKMDHIKMKHTTGMESKLDWFTVRSSFGSWEHGYEPWVYTGLTS
jgi:hypothetical protein